MNRLIHMAAAAATLSLMAVAACAAPASGVIHGPAITDAGAFHAVPHAAYEPNPAATYKIVFPLTARSRNPGDVNPGLETVARLVNTYAYSGVPTDHMKFVAVAYGPATSLVLDDAHYRKLFGVSNPNLPVLQQLMQHDVHVTVCGQALAGKHYQAGWVAKGIPVSLSALTTLTELQQKGYVVARL